MRAYVEATVWILAVVLAAAFSAEPSNETNVHLYGRLNKSVVAVGEPFVFQVEAYALVAGEDEAEGFRRAFDGLSMAPAPGALRVVRREETVVSVEVDRNGQHVARASLRIVFRAGDAGSIVIPTLFVDWAGKRLRLPSRTVAAYRISESFHRAGNAIVPVFVERKDEARQLTYKRTGSAFFIRHDALVTSYHVVADARRVNVLLPDGSSLESKRIWGIDPIRDVVVLHVDPERVRAAGIRPLELTEDISRMGAPESAQAKVVLTNGWPGGVRRSTAGVAYSSARLGFDRTWISSNGVRPGDSGGPLMNEFGEVIGVITLGTKTSEGPDVLQEDVCVANDPRPAIGQMNLALGTRSMRSVFGQPGFRERPYVQAFRLLAMISLRERFDESLREALASFESAVEQREADPGLHFMRGILYRMLGTDQEANTSFSEVIKLFEGFFPASYLLGLDHLQKREFADAAEHFERTRREIPYKHLAEYGLAQSRMGLHEYDEALVLLEEVLDYDPYFAPALYDLALCHMVLGNSSDVTLVSARLGHVSRLWQKQLHRIASNPILQPRHLRPLPRATLASPNNLE
jgi:S1-C subfamily serine protease